MQPPRTFEALFSQIKKDEEEHDEESEEELVDPDEGDGASDGSDQLEKPSKRSDMPHPCGDAYGSDNEAENDDLI